MTDEELIVSLNESLALVRDTIQKLYARISQRKKRHQMQIKGDAELLDESIELRGVIKREIDNARLRIAVRNRDSKKVSYLKKGKDKQKKGNNKR